VGRWNFDEGSGTTTKDSSGWGSNGIISGAVYDNDTPYGRGSSLKFNGSSDYVGVSNPDNLNIANEITVEAWVKPDYSLATTTYKIIICKMSQYSLSVYDGNYGIGALIGNGSWQIVYNSAVRVPDKIWSHVAMTYDNDDGNLYMYLNGAEVGKTTKLNSLNQTASNIFIGWSGGTSSEKFPGFIDNIIVYSVRLTASQIQSQYYVGLQNLLVEGQITEQEYFQRLAVK